MNRIHALIDFAAPPDELAPVRAAFLAPERELIAYRSSDVCALLEEAEGWARRGFWCVGYLRYEAASAFEPRAPTHAADGPLAYFSIHRERASLPDMRAELPEPVHWSRALSRKVFDARIERIHRAIADGEIYQVNYTAPLLADYDGDAFALFCALKRAQPKANAAYIANGVESVLSVSPELFFDWQDDALRCAPMKGTAPRGHARERDLEFAAGLRSSPKERAENVMIVDLIRNDMSRVAQLGSVRVPGLFEIRSWPTVWQMTSQVTARTRADVGLREIFQALFPCGSVTGAPKLRAMHWIKEVEPAPRGVYCGAVGVIRPGGAARFNVPIRTVTLRGSRATCGIGSGITADATAHGEWAEWTHKARFLHQASQPSRLLQSRVLPVSLQELHRPEQPPYQPSQPH